MGVHDWCAGPVSQLGAGAPGVQYYAEVCAVDLAVEQISKVLDFIAIAPMRQAGTRGLHRQLHRLQ